MAQTGRSDPTVFPAIKGDEDRMSVRDLAKRVALLAPPVRTLYEAMLAEGARTRALQSDYARSVAYAEEQMVQFQSEHRRLQSNFDRLQSDYELSIAHTEDLHQRLRQAELRREQVE